MKTVSVLILSLFLTLNTVAQNKINFPEKDILINFIHKESKKNIDIEQANIKTIVNAKDTLFTIFYNSDFFIIYGKHNQQNPIFGYSFQNGLNQNQLKEQEIFLKQIYRNSSNPILSKKNTQNITTVKHGPLLESSFGQTNCHSPSGSIVNVTNIFTPNNYAVGCVAISLTTVLHYDKWPLHGSGENSYSDYTGASQGTYSANFNETYYDWDHILNKYDHQESSSDQRVALGRLAYHAAIALNMNFENGGSTSNVSQIPNALMNYFKHYGEYRTNNSTQFFTDIDSMIVKNTVVPLAVSGNGNGHSIICDGWQIVESGNKYYHLNMGWWGASDGWYQIQNSFNAGGYSVIDGGVFNIVPTPDIDASSSAGSFSINWQIPKNIEFSGFELQVKIGRAHWATLANLTNETSFTTENDGESNYAFRIRMKYNKFPDITAWSNIFIFDNSTTDINTKGANPIKIYPNPVSNILFIENVLAQGKVHICISDILGKKQREIELNDLNKTEINISNLNKGTYILSILSKNFNQNYKFIKN